MALVPADSNGLFTYTGDAKHLIQSSIYTNAICQQMNI